MAKHDSSKASGKTTWELHSKKSDRSIIFMEVFD